MFQNQGNWSLRHPFSKLSLQINFEDAWGYGLEFCIFILIWILSFVRCPMFQILALCPDFEGAKKIHDLEVLIWGFGGRWWFMTEVWYLDLDLNMVIGLWYTYDPKFSSLSWFWRYKEQPCSFRSWFGVLEDAGGFWLGFGILILIWMWSVVFDTSMIQIPALYLDFEGAKNIHFLWVLIWGFGGCWRFLTGVWHLDLDLNIVTGHW